MARFLNEIIEPKKDIQDQEAGTIEAKNFKKINNKGEGAQGKVSKSRAGNQSCQQKVTWVHRCKVRSTDVLSSPLPKVSYTLLEFTHFIKSYLFYL